MMIFISLKRVLQELFFRVEKCDLNEWLRSKWTVKMVGAWPCLNEKGISGDMPFLNMLSIRLFDSFQCILAELQKFFSRQETGCC